MARFGRSFPIHPRLSKFNLSFKSLSVSNYVAISDVNNLVTNGSFETGTGTTNANFTVTGWQIASAGGTSLVTVDSTSDTVSGKQSIKMAVDASNSNVGIKQSSTFTVLPSTTYLLSIFVRSDSAGTLQLQVSDGASSYLQFGGGGWDSNNANYQTVSTTTTWTAFTLFFTTSAAQTALKINEIKRTSPGVSQASRTFWLDNVEIGVPNITKTIGKRPSDSVTLSDAIVVTLVKGITDSITLSDTVINMPVKKPSDSVTLSDVASQRPGKSLTDSITLTDSSIVAPRKIFSDTITLSDAITTRRAGKVLSDTITLTDRDWEKIVKGTTSIQVTPTSATFTQYSSTSATWTEKVADIE